MFRIGVMVSNLKLPLREAISTRKRVNSSKVTL